MTAKTILAIILMLGTSIVALAAVPAPTSLAVGWVLFVCFSAVLKKLQPNLR